MAFIYQADVWCDECGRRICEELKQAGKAPADVEDKSSYDSDDYPKRYNPDAEESDSPQNCASGSCGGSYTLDGAALTYGKFLENGLTPDGYRYVRDTLNENGSILPEPVQQWAELYGFTYFEKPYKSAHEWLAQTIQFYAAEIHDRDGGNKHAAKLVSIANLLAAELDGDAIEDQFQTDMDSDDYFKEPGWYSPEME